MQHTEATRPCVSHVDRLHQDEYNFKHFRTKHLLGDLQATADKRGIPPGAMAPDFELPRVNGAPLRLSDLRGMPTLLHFGSFT